MSVPSKRKPWLPLLVLWLCASCGGHIPSSSPGLAAREGYVGAGGGVRLLYRVVGAGRDTVVVLHGGAGGRLFQRRDLDALLAAIAAMPDRRVNDWARYGGTAPSADSLSR
jgi:hypothetical protein